MGGDWDGWNEKNVSAKSIPLNRDCIHALCQLSVPHCVLSTSTLQLLRHGRGSKSWVHIAEAAVIDVWRGG